MVLAAETALSSAARRRLEPERRHVTVALCGCDFAIGAETSDPEDQHEYLEAFGRFCSEMIIDAGGVVVESSGHEVLACFGFPVSHEDAARRAVRFGLRLLLQLADLNRAFPAVRDSGVNSWCVIHSGPAVVGAPEATESISLVGGVRQIVAGLGQSADAGAVTITDATLRLVSGFFHSEPLAIRSIRGAPDPMATFRVLAETAAIDRVDLVAPRDLTLLVGRESELSILKDGWERSLEEMGQIIQIVGDPGLGKSRLIREAREFTNRAANAIRLGVALLLPAREQQLAPGD